MVVICICAYCLDVSSYDVSENRLYHSSGTPEFTPGYLMGFALVLLKFVFHIKNFGQLTVSFFILVIVLYFLL